VLLYVLLVSIVLFYVLLLCTCVLYFCHRVATQLQLNISYHNDCPICQIYRHSRVTFVTVLTTVTTQKSPKCLALLTFMFLSTFIVTSCLFFLSPYFSSFSLYFNPSLLIASIVHVFKSLIVCMFLTCVRDETRLFSLKVLRYERINFGTCVSVACLLYTLRVLLIELL
jgi:hypothetical protein